MFRPSFLVALTEFPEGPITAVEIGCNEGINAADMLKACDRLDLVCVDIVRKPEATEALLPYKDRVKFIEGTSVKTALDFPDNHFDFIYIDGAHDEVNVLADMKAWYPKLRVGGVFSGHDWWCEGVRKGVEKFFTTEMMQRLYGIQNYSTHPVIPSAHAEFMDWWFVKT